jgi:SAM-dependent methyltransferase
MHSRPTADPLQPGNGAAEARIWRGHALPTSMNGKAEPMGEIFERPLPVVGLAFTGERLTSEFGGQTEIEHLHRYMLARHLCHGRRVLDIASGEGYGAAMLAQVATSVVGIEIAAEVVAHAAGNYQRKNLSFLTSDARAIPLENSSIDVVISFETIEHFTDHDRFLAEIRRVLGPGGLLVISTPDRDNYSPTDRPANPYHALELTCPEYVSRHCHVNFTRSAAGYLRTKGAGQAACRPHVSCRQILKA